MIAWLADAGGWGHDNGCRSISASASCRPDADTPHVPFRKGPGLYRPDSDIVSTFPLPAGGGIEGAARISVQYRPGGLPSAS